MDFLNRSGAPHQPGVRPATTNTTHTVATSTNTGSDKKEADKQDRQPNWLRIAFVIMLFSLTIVTIAVVWLLHNGGNSEANRVNGKKYQAVFLTNGQVYFGKIKTVGSSYLDLQNIYYLNTQDQTDTTKKSTETTSDFSLVKLGCELHGPADQMLINREQVTFWENLKDDSQVTVAIGKFIDANPDGQKCTTTSSSTQQSATDESNADTSTTN